MKKNVLYVYGTLRPNLGETVEIPGQLYALGWFPGAKIMAPGCNTRIIAERIEVDDAELRRLDHYEGYYPDAPHNSLFIRKPYLDGEIYEYNGQVDHKELIPHGDWLKFKNERDKAA